MKKLNQSGIAHLALIGVIVLVLAIGGVGWYVWDTNKQPSKSENTRTETGLQKPEKTKDEKETDEKDETEQVKIHNENNPKTEQNLSAKPPAAQADLEVAINGAQYCNPGGTVTEGSILFCVNATFTNKSSNQISLKTSDFHLKDLQHNEYLETTFGGATTLPEGWVSLLNKTLEPRETLRGTVFFHMTSNSPKDFNFINVTKSYSLTSSN